MSVIIFGGHFVASKVGKTGLVDVTVRITRITLADLTLNALVTDVACTEDTASAKGGYLYRLAGADLSTYAYVAYMTTADATVDQKTVAAMQELVGADILSILGSVLSETMGGYLAAGFKKLFDVASPVLTAASVNQTGDSFARLGAPSGVSVSADILTLLNRLGAFTGTGVNTVLGVFKALFSKAAALPSDITGTNDPATDSTEALREAVDALSLTWAASALATSVATGAISQVRGDVWNFTLTGLASNTGYSAIDFSIKARDSDLDTAAWVHFRVSATPVATDGLQWLMGHDPTDPTAGSITVNSATSITIHLDADKSCQVPAGTTPTPVYDVQYLFTGTTGPVTAEKGTFTITADVTRAVA